MLIEVLGADDRPEWDTFAVASQFRLRTRFPRAAESDAARHHPPGAAERKGRVDQRDRLTFTIDPEDARDHDDALSVAPVGAASSAPETSTPSSPPGEGHFEVGIHIADVSHYVTQGSHVDHEAELRGTSVYLPGGVLPMLPEALSSDLCSLKPDTDRLALSVIVQLDLRGGLHGVRFEETVIRSRHRFHYGEVQDSLDGRGSLPDEPARAIETLMRLARGLRARRRGAGALDLDVPEVKVWVDDEGRPLRVVRRPHLESHELIEEFMLLANRCVGAEGARRNSGLLYRVHDPPGAPKLADLDRMLRALGLPSLGGHAEPARALQALLRTPLDPGRKRLLHRLVLRSLARARYLGKDTGHFGLAAREYCHFTSPIRRYPDLHNHRRVREWIRGRPTGAWDPHALEALAGRCSAAEQDAADAEREAVKVKCLRFLEGRLGDEASGIITGLVPQGFFVELDDDPVEGFVRVGRDLDDQFTLDPAGVRLTGRRTRRKFALGDTVRVVVARVDVPARECDFALRVPEGRRRRRHHGRS